MNNIDNMLGIPKLRMLSDEQIKTIYEGVLDVLENQGSIISHKGAREMLLNGGAKESADGKKVLIPREMVKKAVESAPKSIKLYDRNGNECADLGGYRTSFGMTCDAVDTIDVVTHKRRPFVSDDWYTAAKMVDYLPNVDCMIINGCAADMEAEKAYREIVYAVMLNSRAPVGLCMGLSSAVKEGIGLAELIAGGPENFKKKPTIYIHAEPVTPLEHHEETVDMLLHAAEHCVPVVYYGMQMQGVTTPITSAGTLIVSLAESLAGLVIHQLKRPGAPFIIGGIPATMDMKTTVFAYGSPEMNRNVIGFNEVAHYLNIPNLGTVNSDSKSYDAQCGVEYGIAIYNAIVCGHNMVHDIGFLDQSRLFSLQVAVLCNEIISWCRSLAEGIRTDDESLALDVINEVGAGGNFLMHKHSLKRFKQLWNPHVFDREADYAGVESMETRLENEVNRILDTHVVPSLPDEMLAEIDEYKKTWDKIMETK
jgi:trimethylamine--corrinoid protein Co-methyltransferase